MRLIRGGLRVVQRFVPRLSQGGTWILAYHLVDGGTGSVVDISSQEFRSQMDALAGPEFQVIRLRDVLAHGAETIRVALTFDDAFANFAEVVAPILAERGFPATLFVPTGFVDGDQPSPLTGAAIPACGWDMLQGLVAAGFDIGSHTVSHRNLRRLPNREVSAELQRSRMRLEERLGGSVDSFCYPQAKWSRATRRLARRHYRLGVVAGGRPVGPKEDPLSLPRLPIRRGGPSLGEMLSRRVWLEEQVAARVRQLL